MRSDPDKECDIDNDSNKDVFSPQAFLLIRLMCEENKLILTKSKRKKKKCAQRIRQASVTEEERVRFWRFLGVK